MDFNPLSCLTVEHDKLMHLNFSITAITTDAPVLPFRDQKVESEEKVHDTVTAKCSKCACLCRNNIYSPLSEYLEFSNQYKLSLGA